MGKLIENNSKSSTNYNWWLLGLALILFFLLDVSKLKNLPTFIYYFFFLVSFILLGCFWAFSFRNINKWYLEVKSILWYLVVLVVSSAFATGILMIFFSAFIIYYEFDDELIIKEKCFVTHVSSGKYASLSYEFRRETFSTKDYYYQDYKDCGYNKKECYVLVTLKEKPMGMFLEISVDKWYN